MGRFVDSMIALRILTLLVTPFDRTPAFRLGIIDAKGKELKKMSSLNTIELRDAYTLLHRLVYRLKRIIEKVPIDNKKLVSLAAAYSLIRECSEKGEEPIDLEVRYINIMKQELHEEILLVDKILNENKMFTFKQFTEEVGGVAANNAAASPGVAGLPPDQPPVSKRAQKKYQMKNNMFRRQ